MTTTTAPRAAAFLPAPPDRQINDRIRTEFQEMPGMRLTLRQASRLFDVDPSQCARVLQTLVDAGALWTDGREFLGRDVGRRFS